MFVPPPSHKSNLAVLNAIPFNPLPLGMTCTVSMKRPFEGADLFLPQPAKKLCVDIQASNGPSGLDLLISGIETNQLWTPASPTSSSGSATPPTSPTSEFSMPSSPTSAAPTHRPFSVTSLLSSAPAAEARPIAAAVPIVSATQEEAAPGDATVITVYHSCVAQKSYGNEKRFLCPPPIAHITGCNDSQRSTFKMAIMNEDGTRGVEHKSGVDESNKAVFKYLHVSSTLKSKRFNLKLRVFLENQPAAFFDSKPITIISKPSKKTTKTRNHNLSILSGSTVALFNRVNSQTVRTKYLSVEGQQLTARNSSWSTFEIIAVNGPPNQPITYGMEVKLREVETGVCSDVLVLRKISKNAIQMDATGPVSQLQKTALQLKGQSNLFLATVPTPATVGPLLCYQRLSMKSFSSDQFAAQIENYLTWTIVGIEKSQYTYRNLSTNTSFSAPQVNFVTVDNSAVEMHGSRLDNRWSIAIGHQVYKTYHPAANAISCVLPSLTEAEFTRDAEGLPGVARVMFPLMLVRDDGLVYHTGRALYYERSEGTPFHLITKRVVDLSA